MKDMNVVRRFGGKFGTATRNAAIALTVPVMASPAFAALPEGVQTAVDTATGDLKEGGGLIIGAVAVLAGLALVIAVFRKA
ncbi:hypothetical protein [Halopseudomonas maritima]|uniref:hypothetical protein n=1 Tax=Halopseudomonas maritima TaxID=2918528 RepID=UPI001EEAE136|nr:hypothetical protein [Halopseudomonas maritima]UJJ32335.1 major capsid protein [Halopseudomonas maritima]